MRGNSGFLRWLPYFNALHQINPVKQTILIAIILVLLAPTFHAGPVNTRHRRMVREIFKDLNEKYQNDTQIEEIGTCLLDGVQIPKNIVNCEKKAGCRAIQKTGYCCPDYRCDCERDGKIYLNGEKLSDPTTPCTVCYCQGGEILCSNVTCYERDDCEPKFVQGRCCPEYDNCPPLDYVKPSINKESPTSEIQSTLNSSSNPSSTIKPEMPNNNPLGIKIKEITKPEEIRITDEKPKPIYPIVKPLESSTITQTVPVETNNQQQENPSTLNENLTPPEVKVNNPTATATATATAAATETANKLETSDLNVINAEDSQKTVRHTSSITGNKNESPESPEDLPNEENKSTNKSQTGEEVVIIDSNGNTKPITVFGAEGLQRGEDTNDNVDDNKNIDKRTPQDLELAASNTEGVSVLPNISNVELSSEEPQADAPLSSENEGIDTILHTIESSSTEDNFNLTGIIVETVYHAPDISSSADIEKQDSSSVEKVEKHPPEVPGSSGHIDDYDTTSNEPNPAYPTIVDEDLSTYCRLLQEGDELSEGNQKGKSSMQKDEPMPDQSTEGIELKIDMNTEGLPINLTDSIEGRKAPGEPLLIPEWERNTTESILSNESEDKEPLLESSLEIDSGSGSGGGQLMKDAAFKDGYNCDSEESSADYPRDIPILIARDPKNDAESINYNNSPLEIGIQNAFQSIYNIRKNFVSIQ